MPNPPVKPAVPRSSAQLSYQDVIHRMQNGGKQPSNDNAQPPASLDMAAISNRLANAVELRTVASVVKDMEPAAPTNHSGATFAPIDLAALITAMTTARETGKDTSEPMMALLKYVQETDRSTLQQEMAELRHTLSQPGGNPTLETIQVLKELGLVGSSVPQSNPTIELLTILSTLGLLGNTNKTEQPTFLEQLEAFKSAIEILRPPQPAAPTSLIQFPGGGTITFPEWIMGEELRDKRQERKDELELKRDQIKTTRDLISTIAESISEAAAAVKTEGSGVAALDEGYRRPPKAEPAPILPAARNEQGLVKEVHCDYCDAPNQIDLRSTPDSFICAACHEENTLVYANS